MEVQKNLKPGNVVKNMNDGQKMTVRSIEDNKAECDFFVGDDHKREVFNKEDLMLTGFPVNELDHLFDGSPVKSSGPLIISENQIFAP